MQKIRRCNAGQSLLRKFQNCAFIYANLISNKNPNKPTFWEDFFTTYDEITAHEIKCKPCNDATKQSDM